MGTWPCDGQKAQPNGMPASRRDTGTDRRTECRPIGGPCALRAKGYSVDREAIRQRADAATTGDSRYTPSNARREARKLDTQASYERLRKEFRALKQRRPELSDVRCCE